jgi:nucleotide-binding universal stress UspA family protein
MSTMLVATDLSARADRALKRALLLARQHEAELQVLHIVDQTLSEAKALKEKDEAERLLSKLRSSDAADKIPAITIEVKVGKGSRDILAHAEEISAELIILGARHSGKQSIFRGTLCDHIVRRGNVPVLVVKDHPDHDYERVAVAVDFSVHSRRAIEGALNLAPAAEIYLVHAYHVPFEGRLGAPDARREVHQREQQRMQQMVEEEMAASLGALKGDTSRLHPVLKYGNVKQVIRQEVGQLNPQLLALGTHGRTGIAHAVLGSIAEDLLADPLCDTLAVKAW